MKVLLVFRRMGIGGAETMIMNVMRYLNQSNISFDFVVHTPLQGEYDKEIISMGGNIFVCPEFKIYNVRKYNKWWKNHLRNNHYDILHGNYRQSALLYLRIAKMEGIKTIFHTHSAFSRTKLSSLRVIAAKIIYHNSDYIFACSKKAAEWLFGNKILQDPKLAIIHNGIKMDEYSFNLETRNKYRKELNVEDKFVVCHVGRFAPMKNHAFLIEVFSKIKAKLPNAVLLLIGDGENKTYIEDVVHERRINDVIFLGIRLDVPQLLQAADVFVLPSLFEGLPVSLIEAQAASLPCVFSDDITNEAVIGSNIKAMSLHQSPEVWANEIIEISKQEIRGKRDYSNNPFNIRNSSRTIKKYYDLLSND